MALAARRIMFYGEGIRLANGEPLKFRIPPTISPHALGVLEEHIFVTSLRQPGDRIPTYTARAPAEIGIRVLASRIVAKAALEASSDPAISPRKHGSTLFSRIETDFASIPTDQITSLGLKLAHLFLTEAAYDKLLGQLEVLTQSEKL